MKVSRGIRNNNPGNIRRGGEWKGLVPIAQQSDKSFCRFISPEYGIRAMVIILRNYQRKHKLCTVSGIIHRWAPPGENNTQAYISSVAEALGVSAEQRIDVTDNNILIPLLKAIIKHENGQMPYNPNLFVQAIHLAG